MTTLIGSSSPLLEKHEGLASAARAIMTEETPAEKPNQRQSLVEGEKEEKKETHRSFRRPP